MGEEADLVSPMLGGTNVGNRKSSIESTGTLYALQRAHRSSAGLNSSMNSIPMQDLNSTANLVSNFEPMRATAAASPAEVNNDLMVLTSKAHVAVGNVGNESLNSNELSE